MSEGEINPNAVQIHLNFQQNNDQLHVDFQFDTVKDDLDSVVNDLISTLGIAPEQTPMVKQLISEQIRQAIAKSQEEYSSSETMSGSEYNPNSPSESPLNSAANLNAKPGTNSSQINPDDDDTDEILNDPEYIQLLQKQQKELQEMEARHESEQRNLAQKLTTKTQDDDLLIF
ncbi:hypothetical protein M9Y10_008933 [Tritrichomonas musculus]|uniref:Uncharacterized protein n=1 Tax=Tritrichomonas musculus TaxID=1915356 RepID=A0ABR2J0G8_9EUKA